jgi:hypothetical protein
MNIYFLGRLVNGVDLSTEPDIVHKIWLERPGERVRSVNNIYQVAENILIVVREPLNEGEVIAAFQVEEGAEH